MSTRATCACSRCCSASRAAMTIILGAALARGLTKRINRLGAAINRRRAGRSLGARARHGHRRAHRSRAHLQPHDRRRWRSRARASSSSSASARGRTWRSASRTRSRTRSRRSSSRSRSATRSTAATTRATAQLLDTTLEIVEEEVGTLRRLVGNFSNFARLPHAELAPANLSDFLRDCENSARPPRGSVARRGLERQRADPGAERRDPLGGARATRSRSRSIVRCSDACS